MVMNAEEADSLNIKSLEDLSQVFPALANTAREYFKIYKVPSGKPINNFAYDGEFQDAAFAHEVIR